MLENIDSVGLRVPRSNIDTTSAFSCRMFELNVALVTPASAPRVTDKYVVHTVLHSVANGKHSVVKFGTTSSSGENSALVGTEH